MSACDPLSVFCPTCGARVGTYCCIAGRPREICTVREPHFRRRLWANRLGAIAREPTGHDDISRARTAREVPRLTDEATAGGVSLDVALVPPSRPGKR